MPFNDDDIGIEVGFLGMSTYNSQLAVFGRKSNTTFRGVGKSVDSTKEKFRSFTDEVPGLGRAMSVVTNPVVLVAAAVAGLGLAFTKSVSAAADFNNEFLELQNLNTDKTAAQIAGLNDSILDVSLTTGRAATDISKAFFDVQSGTGLFGDAVADTVTQIANFSTATKTDLNAAINGVVKGMAAFGFAVKDIDGFLASQFATVAVGITTFDQLNQVSVEFAGSAAAIGQSFDTANKVFAAFSVTSKNTQIAATQTKAAFQDLSKASTVKGLKSKGIPVFDEVTGKMRNATDIITDMVGGFKLLNDAEFSELKEDIGGSEGLRGLLDAARTQGDKLLETFEGFDKAKDNFDIEDLLANAKGDFETLKNIVGNQINTIFIRLGQEILPFLAVQLNKVSKIIQQLPQFWEENKRRILTIGSAIFTAVKAFTALRLAVGLYTVSQNFATAAAIAWELGVAAAKDAVALLETGILGLASGLYDLVVVLAANPIGLLAIGVAAATVALFAYTAGAENVVEATQDMNAEFDRLIRTARGFGESSNLLLSGVGRELGDISKGTSDGSALIEKLKSQLEGVDAATESATDAFNNASDAAENWLDATIQEGEIVSQIDLLTGDVVDSYQELAEVTVAQKDILEAITALEDERVIFLAKQRAELERQGLLVDSINRRTDRLKTLNEELGKITIGSEKFIDLAARVALANTELDKAKELIKDIADSTQKIEPKAIEGLIKQSDELPTRDTLPGTDGVDDGLENANTVGLGFLATLLEISDALKDMAVNAVGDFVTGMGHAIASGEGFKDVLSQLGEAILVEAPRYAGLALLNAATTAQPFPVALGLAAAGLALLGLSGIASGALDKARQGDDTGDISVPSATGAATRTPSGLGSFAADDFGSQANIQIFMDGREITGIIRNRIDIEKELELG